MRKVTIFLLSIVMCLSIVSCGSYASTDDSESQQTADVQEEVESSEDQQATEDLELAEESENTDTIYYSTNDTVETDIVRVTVEAADFAIALNDDYVLPDNTSEMGIITGDYGTPVEYVDGESYRYVASKGHTLVALTLTTENLDRGVVQSAIKGISVTYKDDTYTNDLYSLAHSDDGGTTWTASGWNSNRVPKEFKINYYYLSQGETSTERIYMDIAVEVDSLTDSFVLTIPVQNSSGEYEYFNFTIG